MSKAEHAGPRRDAGEGKQMMSVRHHPRVFVCAFVSAHFPVCVRALARVSDLFPGTPHQGL